MVYANLNDVAKRLGRTISDADEVQQVNTWLGDAERIILRRIPDLAVRVTAGTIAIPDVKQVEAQAVIRKIKNPDGKQNERIDDYSYGLTEDASKGELFITDEEWALLEGAAGATGAFTIWPFPQAIP